MSKVYEYTEPFMINWYNYIRDSVPLIVWDSIQEDEMWRNYDYENTADIDDENYMRLYVKERIGLPEENHSAGFINIQLLYEGKEYGMSYYRDGNPHTDLHSYPGGSIAFIWRIMKDLRKVQLMEQLRDKMDRELPVNDDEEEIITKI